MFRRKNPLFLQRAARHEGHARLLRVCTSLHKNQGFGDFSLFSSLWQRLNLSEEQSELRGEEEVQDPGPGVDLGLSLPRVLGNQGLSGTAQSWCEKEERKGQEETLRM